jgi:hypothetical protein
MQAKKRLRIRAESAQFQERSFYVILTINFTDKTECLAFCNINIDTNEPDAILTAYQETIPKVHTPGYSGTAAQLLQEVTGIVMQEHPDMVVVSVNDDRKLSASPEHTLNIELVERYVN